jgi:hypothetical protein
VCRAVLDVISDKDISVNLTTVQCFLIAQLVKICVRYSSSVFAVYCFVQCYDRELSFYLIILFAETDILVCGTYEAKSQEWNGLLLAFPEAEVSTASLLITIIV